MLSRLIGHIKAPAAEAMRHNLLYHLASPGRHWWEQDGRGWLARDYRQYLDDLIAAHDRGEDNA